MSDSVVSLIYKALSIVLILGALFHRGWAKRIEGNAQNELALIDINMLFILSVILSPACSYQNYIYLIAPLLVLFLIGWGYKEYHPKFFWFSLVIMLVLNSFTRNSLWRKIGIADVNGGLPFLVFTVWPIISLVLYFLLYFLRSRILRLQNTTNAA